MFDKWTVETKLFENIEGHSHSFIPLYGNISCIISIPRLSNRAKSHLEHKDYEEERSMLNDLLSREKTHNTNVSQYMGTIRSKITTYILDDEYICKIEPPLQESAVDLNRNYSIHLIIDHFKKEVEKYHNELRVDRIHANQFKLHREDDNSNSIAIGDEEMLECLKRKLDEYYKTNVDKKVKKFLDDGNSMCTEYNKEFVPKILAITDIREEEDDLKGGCGYNSCPKQKPVWHRT